MLNTNNCLFLVYLNIVSLLLYNNILLVVIPLVLNLFFFIVNRNEGSLKCLPMASLNTLSASRKQGPLTIPKKENKQTYILHTFCHKISSLKVTPSAATFSLGNLCHQPQGSFCSHVSGSHGRRCCLSAVLGSYINRYVRWTLF